MAGVFQLNSLPDICPNLESHWAARIMIRGIRDGAFGVLWRLFPPLPDQQFGRQEYEMLWHMKMEDIAQSMHHSTG
jgi:hypothetical protein